MADIGIGMPAPDFDLPRDGGGRVALGDFKGKPLVLYFYPKDDTSGCTTEAINFTALAQEFAKLGVTVVGVSPDSVSCHDKFVKKHSLSVVLASDEDKAALEAYGVWKEKSMYGRTYMGVERTTYLIGSDGNIAVIWNKVKVPGHAQAVLEAARVLGNA